MPRLLFPLVLLIVALTSAAPARAQEDPAELAQARATYQKEIDFITRPVRDRYISKLDALKRSLGARGDARGAVAVQDEIDRLKASLLEPGDLSRFAGTWKITYKTKVTGQFNIRPNGSVTWTEEAGKAVDKKGRIAFRNGAFLLEFDSDADRLWRLSLVGSTLHLEFYSPKNTYPQGPPWDTGTGVNTAAKP